MCKVLNVDFIQGISFFNPVGNKREPSKSGGVAKEGNMVSETTVTSGGSKGGGGGGNKKKSQKDEKLAWKAEQNCPPLA